MARHVDGKFLIRTESTTRRYRSDVPKNRNDVIFRSGFDSSHLSSTIDGVNLTRSKTDANAISNSRGIITEVKQQTPLLRVQNETDLKRSGNELNNNDVFLFNRCRHTVYVDDTLDTVIAASDTRSELLPVNDNNSALSERIAGAMNEHIALELADSSINLSTAEEIISSSSEAPRLVGDVSPRLRLKKSVNKRPSHGSKSSSIPPSPHLSPLLRCDSVGIGSISNATKSNFVDTDVPPAEVNGDDGSSNGDDDEDDGVYDETYRYSSYKYVGEDDTNCRSDVKKVDDDTIIIRQPNSLSKIPDIGHDTRCSELALYDCSGKKNNHQRSLSMTTSELLQNVDRHAGRIISRKVIKRHISLGAETYQSASEKLYEVERSLSLKKPDSVTSYGFHLLGQNPMIVSTVENGSPAELGGVQVGDRLVTINGSDVVTAKESTVKDLVARSPNCIELGVTSGLLSRDICICSGFLNLTPDGIIKLWKKRWCQLKYDGFLYYYATEQCIDPLGAIFLGNYIVSRATNCGRNFAFKLVKYGQKTYYVQSNSEDEMTRWVKAINTAASMTVGLHDTWLDISSHNVGLPALSIKNPECHGFLTKIGNRKKNWRKRYCVVKSACLYYYKDQTSSTAKGVAHLHGYRIEEETTYQRRFGFMAIPPVDQMRTFHFTADNETDKHRWTEALRKSIGKWVKVED